MTPEEAARIDAVIAEHDHLASASSALRREYPGPREDLPPMVESLVQAMDYDAVSPGASDRLAQWGPYAPMIETTSGVYPAPLESVPEETLKHWAEAAQSLTTPSVVARLNDLLWTRKAAPTPHLSARAAIAAYLDVARSHEAGSMDRSDALIRALNISRQLRDAELTAACIQACVDAATNELADPAGGPGAAIDLLEALSAVPPDARPSELGRVLEQAHARYQSNPWLTESICDIELSLGPSEERRDDLIERKIAAWVSAAELASGLVATSHFERALEVAQRGGKKERADELRLKVQQASKDIELSTIEGKVEIDNEEVEAFLSAFTVLPTLGDALTRFGAHCPLPKSRGETAAHVQKQMAESPLQFLTTKVVLGHGNMPLKYVVGPEEHMQSAMETYESMGISLWGQFAGDVLDRVMDKYGPTQKDIEQLFSANELTAIVADRIAEAFILFWEARYDAALLVALPRVETILRSLAEKLGLVIFVEPQAGKPGRFKGLGDLLFGLVGPFTDERRRHYLYSLLANPTGYNLRNSALHGLNLRGTKDQAALAIHALAFLRLVEISSDEDPEM